MSDVKELILDHETNECLVVKKKKEHKKPVKVVETETESESEEDNITEDESGSGSGSDSGSGSGSGSGSDEDGASFTTTEILQNDPLYFVLSRIFMTQDEDQTNVATLLQQIVQRLDVLIQHSKKSSKS